MQNLNFNYPQLRCRTIWSNKEIKEDGKKKMKLKIQKKMMKMEKRSRRYQPDTDKWINRRLSRACPPSVKASNYYCY